MTVSSQLQQRSSHAAQPRKARAPMVPFRPAAEFEIIRANWRSIEQLFEAYRAADIEAILSHYAGEARLNHPLLGELGRDDLARALLSLLREAPRFALDWQINHATPREVEAEWRLSHTVFSRRRPVSIAGTSVFSMAAYRIVGQVDRFDRRAWSHQALGLSGLVLSFLPGWRRILRGELREALRMDGDAGP